MKPAFIQDLHGRDEANVFSAAKQLFGGYAHVFKNDIANGCALLAHFAVGHAKRYPRGLTIDQKSRHPAGALNAGIGAGENREQVGPRCVGDVALGAVNEVVIAVFDSGGADRGGIRAGFWFA